MEIEESGMTAMNGEGMLASSLDEIEAGYKMMWTLWVSARVVYRASKRKDGSQQRFSQEIRMHHEEES